MPKSNKRKYNNSNDSFIVHHTFYVPFHCTIADFHHIKSYLGLLAVKFLFYELMNNLTSYVLVVDLRWSSWSCLNRSHN